jgi:hypothetical protein
LFGASVKRRIPGMRKERPMASEKTVDYNAQRTGSADELRGGTQGGEVAHLVDPSNKEGGTPAITSPAGGVFPPPPSEAKPSTDIGKTP